MKISKKNDKSNHHFFKCNWCNDGEPGAKGIEGRDNWLVKHLMDEKACPHVPQSVRTQARVFLAGKGDNSAIIMMSKTQSDGDIAQSGSSDPAISQEQPQIMEISRSLKRKGTLEAFGVDRALMPVQQDHANVKLFR